ncbi:MAG: hypothetical protein Q8L37_02895 [Candidatus Gottesmanbacteria bacterium]|nr:hypothetical protein [Candidatus Gottesmanbacteria bacterium]
MSKSLTIFRVLWTILSIILFFYILAQVPTPMLLGNMLAALFISACAWGGGLMVASAFTTKT